MKYFIILFVALLLYLIINFLSVIMVSVCGQDRNLVWIKLIALLVYYANKAFIICVTLYCLYEVVDLLLR